VYAEKCVPLGPRQRRDAPRAQLMRNEEGGESFVNETASQQLPVRITTDYSHISFLLKLNTHIYIYTL
jgi:hypothetical protein